MFTQTAGRVRDFVFPLLSASFNGTEIRFLDLLGTGFVIGSLGCAITAAHVAEKIESVKEQNTEQTQFGVVSGFIETDNSWWAVEAVTADIHPTEDVALIQMDNGQQAWLPSVIALSESNDTSNLPYQQWAYPQDVLYDIVHDGKTQERPDLVYMEGYIRRRMTGIPLPAIRGTRLFEVSTAAGPGASGSPLVAKPGIGMERWPVTGIYIGERSSDSGDRVGYAARVEDVRDWRPPLLGGATLMEASKTQSPLSGPRLRPL